MPQLLEYTAPKAAEGIRPDNQGAEALAQAGHREDISYREAAEAIGGAVRFGADQYGKYAGMQEVSKLSAGGAALTANLTESWNQTANSADPNDPATADKWRTQTLEPAIEKFGGGVTTNAGRQYALHFADSLRDHFTVKTAADQSHIAGVAAQGNIRTMQNSLSDAAYADPTSMDHMIQTYKDGIDAQVQSHNMDPEYCSVCEGECDRGRDQADRVGRGARYGRTQS